MQKFLAPSLSILVILGVLGSYYFLYSLNKKVESIEADDVQKQEVNITPVSEVNDECGEVCKSQVYKAVAEAIATISGSLKTPTQTFLPSTKTQTVYIPLDGPVSTTSTAWIDMPGVEVYIDVEKDYSKIAKVNWEASLKVAYGNGQAFARLFDVTHGTAVDGSEITTISNATATNVSSGYLPLWSGRNLYRLQLKSLTSYEATFTSGRIKVTY